MCYGYVTNDPDKETPAIRTHCAQRDIQEPSQGLATNDFLAFRKVGKDQLDTLTTCGREQWKPTSISELGLYTTAWMQAQNRDIRLNVVEGSKPQTMITGRNSTIDYHSLSTRFSWVENSPKKARYFHSPIIRSRWTPPVISPRFILGLWGSCRVSIRVSVVIRPWSQPMIGHWFGEN